MLFKVNNRKTGKNKQADVLTLAVENNFIICFIFNFKYYY